MLRTTLLWIHVLCGAAWVIASLSFVLAAGGSTGNERTELAARVAPVLNRLNLAAIAILPLTGIANLVFVVREHHFRLPTGFVAVLGAKLLLLCAMAAALALAWGTVAKLDSAAPAEGERWLLWTYGAMAACGAVALMLGLWLAGSA
jgi:putative copper export protein